MTSIAINEARAPYVDFEARPVEDREASLANGAYTTKDVDFVLITPSGSKDRVEVEASTWFANMQVEVGNGRFPSTWLSIYKNAYKEWQAGNDLPLQGTPIKTWPVLSPSQRLNLISLKVMTVEDLAGANEEVMRRLGMGGRLLKQQATDYLQAANGPGKLTAQLEEMRVRLDALSQQNEHLVRDNALLKAQVPQQSSMAAAAQEVRDEGVADGLLETRSVGMKKL